MNNHEINPKLKKMLESLQDVPIRDLQASHTGREDYMAQVKSLNPRRSASRKSARQGKPLGRRAWVTRFAAITAVIVVALSSLGGTIYAAQAAQPDDLLYGVKTLTEEIQVTLESDPEEKLDLYISFANRRLQEIQAQMAAGEEVSDKALALLEKHTQKALEQTAKMESQGMEKALRQIENNLQKQIQIMTEHGKEHPQGGPPGLLKAQEKVQERLELVESGIKDPNIFREKMGKDKPHKQGNGVQDGRGNPDGGQSGTENPGNSPGNGSSGK